MQTPTQPLAAFASTLFCKRIPTIVRQATKPYLLDTIDCSIYGSQASWVKTLYNFTTRSPCTRIATRGISRA